VVPLAAAGIDALVLGCTHYSFLAGIIRRQLGAGITVIDPAPAVARQVIRVLEQRDLRAPPGNGDVVYLTTDDPMRLADQVERLLGDPTPDTGRFEVL
jgi:glutamate racemase